MFKNGFQINLDIPLLHAKVKKDYMHDLMVESSEKGTRNDEKTDDFKQSLLVRNQKVFEKGENAGSEISFRCSKCSSCKLCKEQNQSKILSVREQVEQDVINNSVKVNIKNKVNVASLPLMQNPAIKLAPNKNKVLQIYNQHPLDGTHLVAVRGLITKRYSTQERQREELVGAVLLHPIRTNRSSLICRCQFPDSR